MDHLWKRIMTVSKGTKPTKLRSRNLHLLSDDLTFVVPLESLAIGLVGLSDLVCDGVVHGDGLDDVVRRRRQRRVRFDDGFTHGRKGRSVDRGGRRDNTLKEVIQKEGEGEIIIVSD